MALLIVIRPDGFYGVSLNIINTSILMRFCQVIKPAIVRAVLSVAHSHDWPIH